MSRPLKLAYDTVSTTGIPGFFWNVFYSDYCKPPQFYEYVKNSQFTKALEYLQTSSQNPIEEAFTLVDGRSVVHLLLDQDLEKNTHATALLDEIVAQRTQKLVDKEFFHYALSAGRNKQLRHLLWHPNVLVRQGASYTTCIPMKQLSQLLNCAVENKSVEGTQVLVDFCYQTPLIFEGNENSPYIKAVTSKNLKLFLVFANTLKTPLSDDICKTVLLAISRGKVSEEISSQFLKGLSLQQKRNLFLWAAREDTEKIFELLLPCVECDSLRIQGTGGTILHTIAACNSVECLDVMRKKLPEALFSLLDVQDEEGQTALYIAAKQDNSTVVEKFLYWGADYEIRIKTMNKEGINLSPHQVAPEGSKSRQKLKQAMFGLFSIDPEVEKAKPDMIRMRREEGLNNCCVAVQLGNKGFGEVAMRLLSSYPMDLKKALRLFCYYNMRKEALELVLPVKMGAEELRRFLVENKNDPEKLNIFKVDPNYAFPLLLEYGMAQEALDVVMYLFWPRYWYHYSTCASYWVKDVIPYTPPDLRGVIILFLEHGMGAQALTLAEELNAAMPDIMCQEIVEYSRKEFYYSLFASKRDFFPFFCKFGFPKEAKKLLENYSRPCSREVTDGIGTVPMDKAKFLEGEKSHLRMLLETDCNRDDLIQFIEAAKKTEIVTDPIELVEKLEQDPEKLLYLFCKHGLVEQVKKLILTYNLSPENAVFYFCDFGLTKEALEFLNSYQIDPNVLDERGNNPLMTLLCSSKATEENILTFLAAVRNRIDLGHVNNVGFTAFSLANRNNREFNDLTVFQDDYLEEKVRAHPLVLFLED